jgi:hypothetical protein
MAGVRTDGGTLYCDTLVATNNPPTANTITNAHVYTAAEIARSKLATEIKAFAQPLTELFVWDAPATKLPATSSADDLGFYTATFGTSCPLVRTADLKNAGATTVYARILARLPVEYINGGSVSVRVSGGMVTTVASSSATVDIEAYRNGKNGSVDGSDLCSTAAQSINSLTFANKDFTLSGGTLLVGDMLDIRIAIAVNDSATVTAVIAAIASLELLCQIQG